MREIFENQFNREQTRNHDSQCFVGSAACQPSAEAGAGPVAERARVDEFDAVGTPCEETSERWRSLYFMVSSSDRLRVEGKQVYLSANSPPPRRRCWRVRHARARQAGSSRDSTHTKHNYTTSLSHTFSSHHTPTKNPAHKKIARAGTCFPFYPSPIEVSVLFISLLSPRLSFPRLARASSHLCRACLL